MSKVPTLPSSSLVVAVAVAAFAGGFGLCASLQYLPSRSALCRSDTATSENSNLDERRPAPRRFGAAIRLKREHYRRYRELHDHVWDAVLERMHRSNIRNFAIHYHEATSTLFQSFEWIGHWGLPAPSRLSRDEAERDAFRRDMKAIADDPVTRTWWKECEPCQEPFTKPPPDAKLPSDGGDPDADVEWWTPLECVNHCGHWPLAYSVQRRDPDFVKLSDAK
jgi:L-rhamnose mutarotase